MPTTTSPQPCTQAPSLRSKARKRNTRCTNWEGRNKILFSDNVTNYVENPKESTTKLELISLARSHNTKSNAKIYYISIY